MKSETDSVTKQVHLRAPRARVWRALTNAQEFGTWFRVKIDGDFAVGRRSTGHVTYPGYEHLKWEVTIEKMDAEELFSFRWHPYAIDPNVDYSTEPTTLVELRLKDAEGGTLLTVTESGFDAIPEGRRHEAFRMNSEGWGIQMKNIEEHVAG